MGEAPHSTSRNFAPLENPGKVPGKSLKNYPESYLENLPDEYEDIRSATRLWAMSGHSRHTPVHLPGRAGTVLQNRYAECA